MERKEKEIDLDHLTVIIEQGNGTEEFVIVDGEVYTVEEYYELMGYEVNAWREM